MKVSKKTGVLSSIGLLLSNNSEGVRETRSRAKAKASKHDDVLTIKPKMPLKYLNKLGSALDEMSECV